jgi:hypothetical protein
MEKENSSLSVAIAQLQEEGYTEDFNLVEVGTASKRIKKEWTARDCEVLRYFRFEGMTDPDDSSILYAIKTADSIKGLLANNYSAAGTYISEEIPKKLKTIHHE